MFHKRIGVGLLAFVLMPAIAQTSTTQQSTARIVRDPIAGVVLNQTVTVIGQDFYQYFAAAWRDKDAVENFSIAVYERPSARLGTQIWVEFAQRKVFQATLPPSRAQVRAAGLAAADAVHEAVVSAEMQRKLLRDPDMAADEI